MTEGTGTMERKGVGRRDAIWLVAILAAGLLLRLTRLGSISFWADEGFELWMLHRPFSEMMQILASQDAHPPLFEILTHPLAPWLTSEFSARLPSAAFGVTTIYFVYLLSRELFDSRVGLLAASLMALSNYHVAIAMDVRMYSLFCLLSTISMYHFVRLVRSGDNGKRRLLTYGVSTLLLLMTHYFSVFVLLAQNLYWLLHARGKVRTAWPALQAVLIVCAAAVYAYLLSSLRPEFGPPYLGSPPTPWVLVKILSSFFAGATHPALAPAVEAMLLLVTVVPLLLAIREGRAQKSSLHWALPLYTIAPPLVILYAATWLTLRHLVSMKYMIFLHPFVLVWLSAGILTLRGRLGRGLAAAVLLIFLAANGFSLYCHLFVEEAQKQSWKGAAQYVNDRYQPGDLVLIQNSFQKYVADYYLIDGAPRLFPLPEMVPEPLGKAVAPYRRVWYVNAYGFQVDPGLKVPLYLDAHMRFSHVKVFPNFDPAAAITVVLYVR